MTYKEILKLREGAHVVSVNTETCICLLYTSYTFTGTPYFFDILSLEPAE